jgi:hypothetical protein
VGDEALIPKGARDEDLFKAQRDAEQEGEEALIPKENGEAAGPQQALGGVHGGESHAALPQATPTSDQEDEGNVLQDKGQEEHKKELDPAAVAPDAEGGDGGSCAIRLAQAGGALRAKEKKLAGHAELFEALQAEARGVRLLPGFPRIDQPDGQRSAQATNPYEMGFDVFGQTAGCWVAPDFP